MTKRTLHTLLQGREIGVVIRDRGQLRFTYDESWRSSSEAYPLSLSLPLLVAEHPHEPIDAYMWGQLPDNEKVLDRWGKWFGVSARNAFSLLEYVGEECAGAVQFVVQDERDALISSADGEPEIQWLSEKEVAQRLRELAKDQAAWRRVTDTGQFSLAGAQAKTAFHYCEGVWGIPSGSTPTTHILKPPMRGFDGHVANEYMCLLLARKLGLPTASSQVRHFEDQVAIVSERYDRVRTGGVVLRVHQEDMCQALGILPTQKYQRDGGPGAANVVELLREHSSEPTDDVWTFLSALGFNWLIAGTDAHAKNYSVLHGARGRVRLAPLYDLGSVLPYKQIDDKKCKLAMKIGGEYLVRKIGRRHWEKCAVELGLRARSRITSGFPFPSTWARRCSFCSAESYAC